MKKLLVYVFSGMLALSYLGCSQAVQDERPVQDMEGFTDVIAEEDVGEWDVPPLGGETTSEEKSESKTDSGSD